MNCDVSIAMSRNSAS